MNAIKIQSMNRSYGGPPVIENLNLTVPVGHIYGFLGRNGSGKSTVIKTLAGLLKVDSGTVDVFGKDPWFAGANEKQRIGYLSETQILPPTIRLRAIIQFSAPLYGGRWDAELCQSLLSKFGIDPKRRIMQLSLGQQRLFSFVMAIAPRPDLLILDEPAANLDVAARREFLEEILDLIRLGEKTVFFSTHVLTDVERIADSVGILARGSLVAEAPLDDLKEGYRKVRLYDFAGELPREIPGALSFQSSGREIAAVVRLPDSRFLPTLANQFSCQIEETPLPLEDLFIELTRPLK
jgi:ABC-2 type transport system ATP-binding protein